MRQIIANMTCSLPLVFMKKTAFTLLAIFLGTASLHAQTDKPGGYRLPNIAVGVNHHRDSFLVSSLNIGLRPEVDSLKGVQLALFYGGIRHDARGLMVAGVANAAHAMRGWQVGGFSNIVFTPMRGVQLSALTNIAMGVERGLQLSAAANISSGYMHGLQLSTYNYADTLHGTQVGLINVALRHPKGVQVGLINYTSDTIAHKIGLVNINPKTRVDLMAFVGSTSKFNFAFRFRNRSTYSILGAGSNYSGFEDSFSGTVYYRLGQYFNLTPRWSVSGDVGLYHIESFKKNSDEAPNQLYSLQAHLGLDYQINPTCAAFVSGGYGTTRHYGSNRNYRTGFVVQGGLTFRYLRNGRQEARWMAERERDMEYHLRQLRETPEDQLYRFTDPGYLRRRWGRAALMTTDINVLVHSFDRFVLDEDFAEVTFKSIAANWRNGLVWDNDQFTTNLFAHPYHGNLYFNAARSNGLSFWQSTPFALGGSLMWEYCGEVEPPAINDLLATTFGGICLGEITHRISALILNDRSRGFRRFLRETAATLINPMQGLTRITDGDVGRVRQEKFLYHDFSRIPVEFTVTAGARFLADDGGLFRGVRLPYLSFYLNYGDAFDDSDTQPYDYFTAKVTMSLSSQQPLINGVHLLGRLWSNVVYDGKEGKTVIALFQHFNYYDSEPVKDGTSLTPYRISEAAALGPGILWQFPKVGNLQQLEQRIFADLIILGGTKSDYYNMIDRDYNMGSGYSVKSNTMMEFPNFGRFVLNMEYYRIFTWKGYEGKDLSTINPLYLNAQGDRGNAQLFVFNPAFIFRLKHNIGIELAGSYYARNTYYKYHDRAKATTFEIMGGLVYRF